ncbi:hypothetical protein M0R36_10450 [bacterium]|jgi:hypothetical protein|nr:hypothetical protein [bacterium]
MSLWVTDFDVEVEPKNEKFENYESEIDYYKSIFDDSKMTQDDYKLDTNGILYPGLRKESWREIKLELPMYSKDKVPFLAKLSLYIYLKAPLYTILCDNKDELYDKHNMAVNVWPYIHQRKFLRRHLRLVTKNSPTVDMFNFPTGYVKDDDWDHLHSESYMFTKSRLTFKDFTVHNYVGNLFTWGISSMKIDYPLYNLLMTYEFISRSKKQKYVRTCAMGIFDSRLTKWINDANSDTPNL